MGTSTDQGGVDAKESRRTSSPTDRTDLRFPPPAPPKHREPESTSVHPIVLTRPVRLPRSTPLLLAAGRTAIGSVMLARPTLLTRSLGVDATTARRTAWLTQMLGARELALGLGAVAAGRGGAEAARLWVLAQAVSDTGDALALAVATGKGHVPRLRGLLVVATAAGAAAAGGVPALRAARG